MKNIVFILILLSFFGCKKDKLEGDKSVFVGKWRWVYSEREERSNCDNPTVTTTLTPTTEGKSYYLEFNKKGCVTFYEENDKVKKYRIVFNDFQLRVNTSYLEYFYSFSIKLNNDDDLRLFSGYINADTLIDIGFFPFGSSPNSCISYESYFVKE